MWKSWKSRRLGPCRCFTVLRMKSRLILGLIFRAKRSSFFTGRDWTPPPRVVRHNTGKRFKKELGIRLKESKSGARFTSRGFCALNLGTGCKFGRYRSLRSCGVSLRICHVKTMFRLFPRSNALPGRRHATCNPPDRSRSCPFGNRPCFLRRAEYF